MKKVLICTLILMSVLIADFANDEYFYNAMQVFISSNDKEFEIRKAISILSKDLRINPNKKESLIFRAQLYSSIGEFHKAYSDINELVKIKPKSSMYQYVKCTFEESFNISKENCIECYEKVLYLLEAELGGKKDVDIGYIFVLLLAEKPRGRELADNYIATLTNSTIDQFNKDLLLNFDRNKFLPQKRQSDW